MARSIKDPNSNRDKLGSRYI